MKLSPSLSHILKATLFDRDPTLEEQDVIDQVIHIVAVLLSLPLLVQAEDVIDLSLFFRCEELFLFTGNIFPRWDTTVHMLPGLD